MTDRSKASGVGHRGIGPLVRYWTRLDRGWQAALLGVTLVVGHQLLA